MCGICGFTGGLNQFVLKKMTDSLLHRGPDEDGFYSDGRMNLGIRRLSIIDIETGHQPIHNEDKSIWSVFNGEIYNFYELREELRHAGHRFYTDHSDSEVVVHLYEQYGKEFAHKINGMFAIAIWDKKEEELLLIRDRMGVKPLFYTVINNNLVFGSEIKSILTYPEYKKDINYVAIYHYFTFKNIPSPMTAFKGISCLLPGQILSFRKGSVSRQKWWKIRFNEENSFGEEEAGRRILDLLEDATRLRMRSDVPYGAYLSGGVDSSSVVALMTRFSDKPIKTFSLGYEDQLSNKEADIYHARLVSRLYKTDHYEYIMSCKELISDIEKVIEAFDQPFSGTISTYFLTKLIGKHVKVALSGDGADELFGSYLSHRLAQPMHHFSRLHAKVISNSLASHEQELFKPCEQSFLGKLYDKSGDDQVKWRYYLYQFLDEEKDNLLSDYFKSKLNKTSSLQLLRSNFQGLTASSSLNRMLEMEWNTQLPDQVLAFVDFLSMAHSVEIRSPFLDYRLVEFVSGLPSCMKIRNGNVKDILKKSLSGLLPESITQRPKEGFVLPVYEWLHGGLKNWAVECLESLPADLFNPEYVGRIKAGFVSQDSSFNAKVWNLACFSLWWKYSGF